MIFSSILKTEFEGDYDLIDSGEKKKLERYGSVVLSRPDPQALWPKRLPEDVWEKRDGGFSNSKSGGQWKWNKTVPEKWSISLGGLQFWIRPSTFKHTGVFPEQVPNWEWTNDLIQKANRKISVLNLFGYTGGATLAVAKAGADVCHVDGSRVAIGWAKDNAILSGVSEKPIRWILDDAFSFVKREIRRGKKYDGIIMDPPAFGHGPKQELWKIEDGMLDLLSSSYEILSEEPLFFLVNGYASGYSSIAYKNNLIALTERFGGDVEAGELSIQEKESERLLPAGIFARWKNNARNKNIK